MINTHTNAKYSLESTHQIPGIYIENFVNIMVIINYISW